MDEEEGIPRVAPRRGRDIAEIRRMYPNAYEPWCAEDDERLIAGYRSGLSFADLARQFRRQPSAIESRLKKLALEVLRQYPVGNADDAPPGQAPR